MPLPMFRPLSADDWQNLGLKNADEIVKTLAPFYEKIVDLKPLDQFSKIKFRNALITVGHPPSFNHHLALGDIDRALTHLPPLLTWGGPTFDLFHFRDLKQLLVEYCFSCKVPLSPSDEVVQGSRRGMAQSGLTRYYENWTEPRQMLRIHFWETNIVEERLHVGEALLDLLILAIDLHARGAQKEAGQLVPFLELFLDGNLPLGLVAGPIVTRAVLLTT